ncbi:ABC-2 type transport system permease protein [Stackebrandtia albiflava]|uniref:Transport permease protein n=1 Tax=Stackebrandtia albiflava TaxID=406432 RepID=A0A562VCI6_9ACTN|nr:ABC transporter permease [Stackebrandtia albiflava]TWJ15594.1 ABC-2 type transport system permease protein [Stackebrandtia albiflava]
MTTAYVRRRPVSDSMVMVGRSVRHAWRNGDSLVLGVVLPVMILVLFTVVFGGALDTGGVDYVDYVVPGIILLCSGYGASTTAISVTKDMTEGIVDRFRTMTVTGSAVLFGHVAASLLRNLVSTALVVVTAVVLGFRPAAGPVEWLAVAGVVVLFVLAMSWLAAMVGLLTKTVDAAASMSFFMLFLPYASSAFVPIETMPGWLQPVARHQPVTPVIEAMRGWLSGGDVGGDGWVAVAWCVGILVAAVVGSALLWRRSTRD